MRLRLVCIIFLLTLSSPGMAAEFWKCVQKNGKTVYTDMPCPEGSKQHTVTTKNEVRYLQNYAEPAPAPTSFLGKIKSFYHSFFPEKKEETPSAPTTTTSYQPAPTSSPTKAINHRCINSGRTAHFDQLNGMPKTAFSSAEGC